MVFLTPEFKVETLRDSIALLNHSLVYPMLCKWREVLH